MMHDNIRVAVIDDHPLLREGVIHILQGQADIEVVGEGASADDALCVAQNELPDIILLDVSMPGGGVTAARRINAACPIVKIVMLTIAEDETIVGEALAAGARGYILKGVSGPDLVRTLRTINEGANFVTPSLAARLLAEGQAKKDEPDPLSLLTAREEQILRQVAEGMSNREIGDALNIAEKTVKHYMTNILQKLQVRNRVTAALLARELIERKEIDDGAF